MPSPFPGMDPFLERAELFPSLHDTLIIYLKALIQPLLPPNYFATTGQRIILSRTDRWSLPDLEVLHEPQPAPAVHSRRRKRSTKPTTPVVVEVDWEEEREIYLDIYVGRRPRRELVTSIEILSPSNKRSGTDAHRKYLRKQAEMLLGPVHLLEVDLLRCGDHVTGVPLEPLRERAGSYDYHVCLHRFDRPAEFQVHPFRLEDRLPTIAIPLLPTDPPIVVRLQPVFDRAWDDSAYEKQVNYQNLDELVPPLNESQREWAASLLRRPPKRRAR